MIIVMIAAMLGFVAVTGPGDYTTKGPTQVVEPAATTRR